MGDEAILGPLPGTLVDIPLVVLLELSSMHCEKKLSWSTCNLKMWSSEEFQKEILIHQRELVWKYIHFL